MQDLHQDKRFIVFLINMELIGLIGIFISTFLISFIIYKTFKILLKNKINNYEDFVQSILPENFKQHKICTFTISNIVNIFLLISFNIMVAGFATYFIQELHIPQMYGAIIIATLSYIILSNNIDGVIKLNKILIPIIITLIVFLGMTKIDYSIIFLGEYNKSSFCWILSSVLYASYNSIALIPILITLKNKIKTDTEAGIIAFIVELVMIILSLTIFFLMNVFVSEIRNFEIPLVFIASTLGKGMKYVYGFVILMAIFTTAVSDGYGFLKNITIKRENYTLWAITICTLSVIIGQFSFSKLINLLYPVFGYLGIIQIIFLTIK